MSRTARGSDADSVEDPKIFIVDDDEAVRDSLQLLLEAHGMEVESFASTEDFVRGFRPRARQCLILDQHLQGRKTGLEFLGSPQWRAMGMPVILVTGRGDAGIKAAAAAAGASDYLEKPIEAARLLAAIEHALDRKAA